MQAAFEKVRLAFLKKQAAFFIVTQPPIQERLHQERQHQHP